MNVHKNARLTPAGRALLVERLLAGERTEDVAREMGVSRIEDTYGHLQKRRARLSEVRYAGADVIEMEEHRESRETA